jgi:2-C-methyl-D-erythritol 4-phosphate cytidylyltransferase
MMATYSQDYVNQLVQEAAAQAGGTLSYADVLNAANNLGIPASQIQAAVSTGVITGAPSAAPTTVQMPTSYDQAYVNRLVQEAAAQAGGTLSYADAMNAASNLGIPPSMMQGAMSTGVITGAPAPVNPAQARQQVTQQQQLQMPKNYDQAYVNRLIQEAAQQAGGTLSYADVLNAANNLGIPVSMIQNSMNATGVITTNPFANATQGMPSNTAGTYTSIPIGVQSFGQNFQNYMNTPLGAQYNPGVTGGVSPYSQVMGQMRPIGNPYAGVISNQPMGGYDPSLYERERQLNIALRDAGVNPYGGVLDMSGMGGDDAGVSDSGNGIGGNSTEGGMSNSGEGGPDGVGGWAKGGLVDRVAGPNPVGPDDGYGKLKVGEYVIKKSSVNKYGKGLLDMLNDGKIPAKKIKSLLG